MQRYVLTRLAQAVPLLLLITLLVFGLTLVLPGGPLAEFASDPSMTAADLQQLRHDYGLDQPAPVRYLVWLGAMLHGDFGNSYASHEPVAALIEERLPNTAAPPGHRAFGDARDRTATRYRSRSPAPLLGGLPRDVY